MAASSSPVAHNGPPFVPSLAHSAQPRGGFLLPSAILSNPSNCAVKSEICRCELSSTKHSTRKEEPKFSEPPRDMNRQERGREIRISLRLANPRL